jgi:hypothetical protein
MDPNKDRLWLERKIAAFCLHPGRLDVLSFAIPVKSFISALSDPGPLPCRHKRPTLRACKQGPLIVHMF